jgi:hypothetical protein
VRRDEANGAAIELIESKLVNGSGRSARLNGIDQNRGFRALQQIDKGSPRTVGADHFAARQRRLGEHSRDLEPDGVIAKGAANSNNPDQSLSISSLRK